MRIETFVINGALPRFIECDFLGSALALILNSAAMAFKWLAIAALYGSGCANSQPVVDLGYSKYQGTALSSGVNQFLGIRYAKPPLGDLRWRAPIDPVNTTGIQNATAVRTIRYA